MEIGKQSILVVDDDAMTRRFVGSLLAKEGYEVHEAEDGVDGLEAAGSLKPRLIVLDLVMPNKDGFEMMEDLKTNPSTRRIPVVILSMRSREEDIVKGLTLGAEDYVTKPFNSKEFLVRVQKILERAW